MLARITISLDGKHIATQKGYGLPANADTYKNLIVTFDAQGPCANGVKDSQRTKTSAETRRMLSLIWGTKSLPGRAAETEKWYHELLAFHEATVIPVK
jgi:DNA/RNA-binding domain of Phe-tRNA-synthetase-like protein